MGTFIATGTLSNLAGRPLTSEDAYYREFGTSRRPSFRFASIAVLIAGVFITLGLQH